MTNDEKKIKGAKAAFNEEYSSIKSKIHKNTSVKERTPYTTGIQKLTPIWDFYEEVSSQSRVAFETPLIKSNKKISIYNFDDAPLTEEQNNQTFKNAVVRLLSVRAGKSYRSIILNYIPSINYRGNLSEVYISDLKNYSGYIEYQTLNEEIIFVAQFQNGKLFKKYYINSNPSLPQSIQLPQSEAKKEVSTINITAQTTSSGSSCDSYQEIAIPYYGTTCVTMGDPPIEECFDIFIGYTYEYVYIPCDPAPSEPNFCDLPENFYICHNDGNGGNSNGNPPPPNNNYSGLSEQDKLRLQMLEIEYRSSMTSTELKIFDSMSAPLRLKYLANAYTAVTYVENNFNDGFWNGKADAFRHTYFTALNSYDLGYDLAKRLSDAHEQTDGAPQHPMEKTMDLHNNAIGLLFVDMQNLGWDPLQYTQTRFDNGAMIYLTPLGSNGEVIESSEFKITSQ